MRRSARPSGRSRSRRARTTRRRATTGTVARPSCATTSTAREASHPSRIPLVALRAAVERMRDLEAEISGCRAELAEEPDLTAYDVGALPTPEWRRPAVIGAGAHGAGRRAGGHGPLGPIGQVPLVAALAITGVGVGLAVLAIVRRRRSLDVGRQNVLRDERDLAPPARSLGDRAGDARRRGQTRPGAREHRPRGPARRRDAAGPGDGPCRRHRSGDGRAARAARGRDAVGRSGSAA